jgi:site-specific DNA-cytosine methylase
MIAEETEAGGVVPTITGDHQNRVTDYTSIVCAGFNGYKSVTGSIQYKDGTAATLEANMSGNVMVLPFNATQITSPKNGNNPKYGDPCHPLCATDYAPYIVEKTYQKVTGPLMANSHPGSYTGQDAYTDMLVTGVDCRNGCENEELCGTLQKNGSSLNAIHPVRMSYSVRRLTPLECERLQDYPNGWTENIPGASDSGRYKALGNSVAVCCPEYVLEGIKEVLERLGRR